MASESLNPKVSVELNGTSTHVNGQAESVDVSPLTINDEDGDKGDSTVNEASGALNMELDDV